MHITGNRNYIVSSSKCRIFTLQILIWCVCRFTFIIYFNLQKVADYHDLSLLLLAAAWLFFSAFISLVRIFLSWPPGLGRFVFSSASRLLRCLPERQTINIIQYVYTQYSTPTFPHIPTNSCYIYRIYRILQSGICKLWVCADCWFILTLDSC